MAFKTVTILGAQGMLGMDLAAMASQRSLGVRVYDLPEFDITDDKQVEAAVSGSEVIVNCAAYMNVSRPKARQNWLIRSMATR